MKEFLRQIESWQRQNKRIAWARVIQTWGSSPRPVGSCMFISSDLEMAGSVSGGCVEGAVLKEAKLLFESGESKRLSYGVTDDDAWAVGLSCGGKIQVYLQCWDEGAPWTNELASKLSGNVGCMLITQWIDGKEKNAVITNTNNSSIFPGAVITLAHESYRQRKHLTITHEQQEYFIQVFPPRSKVIIIGAAHITADLIQFAKAFDFETIVIDPRKIFAGSTSFPVLPDKILEAYPSEVLPEMTLDPFTYTVILSHDPKIDDDALKILLRSEVAYIGALGSRKNHQKRMDRLTRYGFTSEEISRIDAPIGVDIHAQGAKEIALSIMGAIVRAKNQFA